MKHNITYLQMAVILSLIGVVFCLAKYISFGWGDAVLFKDITINDYWYYCCNAFCWALFVGAAGCMATYLAAMHPDSVICALIKYSNISIAFVFAVRAIAHLITYNLISSIEIGIDVLLIAYTVYRAKLWFKEKIAKHATGYTLENN